MADRQLLDDLTVALSINSDNVKLRLSVIRLALDADARDVLQEAVIPLQPCHVRNPEDQRLSASACITIAAPDRALGFLKGGDPESTVLRAKALLDLNRQSEAAAAYKDAIHRNPALEDASLAAQLESLEVEPENDNGIRLRVISNDDTDTEDIARIIIPEHESVSFNDVHGLESVKQDIRRKIILPFQKPSLFKKFRKRVGGGILLYGPPGCGKTLLARATAGECKARFYNVMISDIMDMYIGESERKLHALFDTVRQNTPAVLFFDEIEAIGAKRQYGHESHSARLVSQFLSEMDGFEKENDGILILGATNVPWSIDPAFRRPGRFDRIFFVPPPDQAARAAILDMELKDRPMGGKIDSKLIAKHTSGYSGADIRNIVELASDLAIEASLDAGQEIPIEMRHLTDSVGESSNTTTEWLSTAKNYARYANDGGQYNDVLDFIKKHGKK